MLLFAQSVLEPEPEFHSMNGTNIDSTATTSQSNPVCFPYSASAPFGGISCAVGPPVTSQTASLRSALLAVKAATLLSIGGTNINTLCNRMALWEAARFMFHNDVKPLSQHTEAYTTESAQEADHLTNLLVQVLLQTMSQDLDQLAYLHPVGMCCKVLHALLATRRYSVSQPLSNKIAAAVANQSEPHCSQHCVSAP